MLVFMDNRCLNSLDQRFSTFVPPVTFCVVHLLDMQPEATGDDVIINFQTGRSGATQKTIIRG